MLHITGIITQYEVFLRGPMEAQNLSTPANERRVFMSSGWPESDRSRATNRRMLPPPESSASITGLQPFSTYQMRVASVNTAGHVTSEWATARTTAGGLHSAHTHTLARETHTRRHARSVSPLKFCCSIATLLEPRLGSMQCRSCTMIIKNTVFISIEIIQFK
jgi:hypothetical protein